MEDHSPENIVTSLDTRVAKAKKIALFGMSISLLLSVLAISSIATSKNQVTYFIPDAPSAYEPPASDPVDLYWAPTGFTVWIDDPNVAYRWAKKNNCDSYDCISAEFISKAGCPNSFYAALNWIDSADSVISYDNASLPSLSPMQIAKLRFDDIDGTAQSGQMAEISCR